MTADSTWKAGWIVAVGIALVVGLMSCGDDSEDPCADMLCGPGQYCVDGDCEFVSTSCEPECEAGEVCIDDRCVAENGGCEHHGQQCSASEHLQWDDDYLCLDWETGLGAEAVCSQDCRTQPCPEGSECFIVVPGFMASCSDETECGDNEVCHEGQCVVATCRPSQCDLMEGPEADCPVGERCARAGTSGDYCVPEGTREPGESCLDAVDAWEQNRSDEGCVAEAVCVGGSCQLQCVDGECPDAERECASREVGNFGAQLEVCSASCTPGSGDDECDADETCVPTIDGDGVCQPAGSVAAFESCQIGAEGCEPGTICAGEESGESLGRCLPVCDLSVGQPDDDGVLGSQAQAARDATCPQPEGADGVWMAWHLAEAGQSLDLYVDGGADPIAEVNGGDVAALTSDEDYQIRDAGTVEWQVHPQGAPSTDVPVAEGSFALDAGEKKILILVPEPGRDQGLQAEVIELDEVDSTMWIHGIPDLESVDLWAVDESGEAERWIQDWSFGQSVGHEMDAGTVDLRLLEAGADADDAERVEFEALEFDGEERFVALRGTMDGGDIHGVNPPLVHREALPDLESQLALTMSCRAINDGQVGGCVERCDGDRGLKLGQCSGEDMGCAPRRHVDRNEWTSICQPVGDGEQGDPCNPFARLNCAEGLFCEEYGEGADHLGSTNQSGRCAAFCDLGDEHSCDEDRGCRQIDEGGQYDVGECRHRCEPDGSYEGEQCPPGKRRCLPEARLVPAGDGVTSAFEIEEQQSFCWVSGSAEPGDACIPGECTPEGECLYERSEQVGLVEALLSPYFGVGTAGLQCRAICDPFEGQRSDHQCADGQTCLFNYPWNANVGHCADIVEERGIGDACDEPGMACAEDSICIAEGGQSQCMRLCQFVGQGTDGYAQSTCPIGYTCQPLVNDIGICD